jgi:hypothetical protein
MTIFIPDSARQYGFLSTAMGAHTGRTIMFHELQTLLSLSPSESSVNEYQNAILEENILGKPTKAARKEAFRRLKQLYSLDRHITIFRSLRMLWEQDREIQSVLALLCAVARDQLLRATVNIVINMPPGTSTTALVFEQKIHELFPDRLSEKTLASVSRNIASSWTQSGHFIGSTEKIRNLIHSNVITTTYALFLAYLCDSRGAALFDSPWLSLLDTPKHILYEQAQQASKQGWLEYRHSGAIIDISFHYLLKDQL